MMGDAGGNSQPALFTAVGKTRFTEPVLTTSVALSDFTLTPTGTAIRQFTVQADAARHLAINFVGVKDNTKLSGLELFQLS